MLIVVKIGASMIVMAIVGGAVLTRCGLDIAGGSQHLHCLRRSIYVLLYCRDLFAALAEIESILHSVGSC